MHQIISVDFKKHKYLGILPVGEYFWVFSHGYVYVFLSTKSQHSL